MELQNVNHSSYPLVIPFIDNLAQRLQNQHTTTESWQNSFIQSLDKGLLRQTSCCTVKFP